jgi:hypothetical protein
MITQNSPKLADCFFCEKCDYKCSKKSDYDKHLSTRKHKNDYTLLHKNVQPSQTKYTCECGKDYSHRQGLYAHKKKCVFIPAAIASPVTVDHSDSDIKVLTDLVIELVKSNTDLQKQMSEVCKNNNNNNNNTINSHNKTFNMHFFLNETCKDAMNLMDFVDSFTLQLSDLEDVSKQGYVDGISNIIMKKLNEMDIHQRPIHCSDAKREIMYVKDKNKWEKEDPSYMHLRKAIKYISKKNSDLLGQWSEAHPASKNITSQTNTEYMKMIMQAMGGKGEIIENENKIIKK